MPDLRFPIGKFQFSAPATPEQRVRWLSDIECAPARMRDAVHNLTGQQLDTPYRPGGWTVRQVIHHVPDSHLHSYARFRFALTEDQPLIKPYHEDLWAELPDARSAPIDVSLDLLDALHRRWIILLRSLDEASWQKAFRHPELGEVTLERALALYAWHGRHHVAHITSLREREGW